MVEEASALLDENDAELLRGLKDGTVVLATTGSGNVLDAGAGGPEYIVDEGELLIATMISRSVWIYR